jgi:hypothetical protein
MSAHSQPALLKLPTLTVGSVQDCVEKTHDLVLLISADEHIAGVFQTRVFESRDVHFWIGQPLRGVVSADTQVKLPVLFAHDAAQQDPQAIWRHINLLGLDGQPIPVRALFMTLQGEHDTLRCLFCRDLRSAQDTHDRFVTLHQDLLCENAHLRDQLIQLRRDRSPAGLAIDPIVRSIKRSTYQKAIEETVENLERACMRALLMEAAGDHRRAAELAGCDIGLWLCKAAHLQLT